jgi:hypothetical protein
MNKEKKYLCDCKFSIWNEEPKDYDSDGMMLVSGSERTFQAKITMEEAELLQKILLKFLPYKRIKE